MKAHLIAASVVALAAGLQAPAAFAQDAGTPSPASTPASANPETDQPGEDIVVTARKRSESQLAVPVAITAVSGTTLEQRGIFSVDAVTKLAPSVIISDAGGVPQGGVLAIRGYTGPENVITSDQAVSFNIDGVQIARATVRRMAQMDISSIEVLKGPQTLFYGKNSPAGVISVHTADPTSTFQAKASLGYEFVGRQVVGEGYFSGPLTDTLGWRVAYYANSLDGWSRDTAPTGTIYAPADDRGPEQKEAAVRGTLRWEPGTAFDARLKVSYDRLRGSGLTTNVQRINCPSPAGPFGGVADDCKPDDRYLRGSLGPTFGAIEPGFRDGVPYLVQDQYLIGLEMNYRLGDGLTLTSQSGYYDMHFASADSLSMTPTNPAASFASFNDLKIREASQEVRLTSDFKGWIDFMIGGFYQHSEVDHLSRSFNGAFALTPIGNAGLDFEGDALSVFGQLLLRPIPKIEIGLGGRYSHERKYVDQARAGLALTPVTLAVMQHSWNNFSPDITLTYRPTKTLSIYGSYRQGFLSGGYSTGSVTGPGSNALYDQQTIDGFEAGIKTESADGRLSANLAAYTYQVKGLLVSRVLPSGTTTTQNAGRVSLKGVDFDIQYRFDGGFRLHAAVGYNRARYDDFTTPCYKGQTIAQGCNLAINAAGAYTLQSLNGQQLARAPEWTGNVGASYDVAVGGDLKLGFSSDVNYSDAYFTDTSNNPGGKLNAYAQLDAAVRLFNSDNKWEAALIGTNLTNKYTWNRSYTATFGGSGTGTTVGNPTDTYAMISRGRQIMLRLTFKTK